MPATTKKNALGHEFVNCGSKDSLSAVSASETLSAASSAIASRGYFVTAVSGGSLPKILAKGLRDLASKSDKNGSENTSKSSSDTSENKGSDISENSSKNNGDFSSENGGRCEEKYRGSIDFRGAPWVVLYADERIVPHGDPECTHSLCEAELFPAISSLGFSVHAAPIPSEICDEVYRTKKESPEVSEMPDSADDATAAALNAAARAFESSARDAILAARKMAQGQNKKHKEQWEEQREEQGEEQGEKQGEEGDFWGTPSSSSSSSSSPGKVIDLFLLGCGPDGHTCSIFPDSDVLADSGVRSALATFPDRGIPVITSVGNSPKPPAWRVTFTPFALATAAAKCVYVASGESKRGAVSAAMRFDRSVPVASLECKGGVAWLLDDAAWPEDE